MVRTGKTVWHVFQASAGVGASIIDVETGGRRGLYCRFIGIVSEGIVRWLRGRLRLATPARQVTFSLREDVLTAVDQAVDHGVAPTANAFVERALMRELQEVRRQARRAAWDMASRDPLFLHDLADTEVAFASADMETARSISPKY